MSAKFEPTLYIDAARLRAVAIFAYSGEAFAKTFTDRDEANAWYLKLRGEGVENFKTVDLGGNEWLCACNGSFSPMSL